MHNANQQRYAEKVRQLLIGAGLEGMSQYELNQKTRTRFFNVAALLQVLNEWERLGWVQAHRVRVYGTRKTTMWRATTKLVEGYANVHLRGITPDIVTEESPKAPLEIDAFQLKI